MKNSLLRPGWWSLALLMLVALIPAHAAELGYGIRLGANYSDNVQRTATDEQSTGAGIAGLDIRGERTSGRLRYDLSGDFEYRDYFEEAVESQEFGRLSLQSTYAFVPDRFEWMLSGSFDQMREDLLRPAAPDNLEDVITLSTGPRLRVQFGDVLEGLAEGRFATADYSEQSSDSETLGGLLTLGHRFSESGYLGVGAAYDEVTYDSGQGLGAPDFQRNEYFLRFRTEGSRSRIEADAGYAEVNGANIDDDGPMFRVRATRRLTPYVSGFVGAVREFPTSTSTNAGAGLTPDGAPQEDPSQLTGAPRLSESAEIGFNMARPRTSALISYALRRETQIVASPLEREVDEVHASLTRMITARSSMSVFGTYTQEKIASSADDFEETAYGLALDVAFGRAFSIDVHVGYRDRESNSSASSGSYDELNGGIFLRYGSTPRFGMLGAAVP